MTLANVRNATWDIKGLFAHYTAAGEPPESPVHSKGDVGRFASVLSWSAVNEILRNQRFTPKRLQLTKDGSWVPPESYMAKVRNARVEYSQIDVAALITHLSSGATLILNAIDHASPRVRILRERIEQQFHTLVGVNLYASWGTTHGFDVHWDDHDVIVLQVHGTKRWRIYEPTQYWPIKEGLQQPDRPTGSPYLDLTLGDGDALYLPRGWWHDVSAIGRPSAHLTCSLLRPRAYEFLQWLTRQATVTQAFRRDLSVASTPEDLASQVEVLRRALNEHLSVAALETFLREQGASVAMDPAPTLQAVSPEDFLTESAGQGCIFTHPRVSVDDTGTATVINSGRKRWQWPRSARELARALADGETVPVADLTPVVSLAQIRDMVITGHAAVVELR